jgi:hypothetical protein
VVDTCSYDSEFVEKNEIQDHVRTKHHTTRKSGRGARDSGVRKQRHSSGKCYLQASSSSLIIIGRRQLISTILAEQRPSSTNYDHSPWSGPKAVLDRPPWRVTSSSGGGVGGTTSSAGCALRVLPPSSIYGGNRATSSSVSNCNKAPVHHRQRSGALSSGFVVTATSRGRSRTRTMKIHLLFIWSD